MGIQLTSDGTHTIHSEKFDVPYHSVHGALQETMHVFIDAGLNYFLDARNSSSCRILEIGFGTGLNVLATISESRKRSLSIEFQTIEAYPISLDTVADLNYAEHIASISQDDIDLLHSSHWSEKVSIDPSFSIIKHLRTIEEFKSEDLFDIIYFDAFAPTAQPELWTPEILQKMYSLLDDYGILVTYCAKGQFKRDLRSVGFEMQSIPGPPRKREMTRAIKSI